IGRAIGFLAEAAEAHNNGGFVGAVDERGKLIYRIDPLIPENDFEMDDEAPKIIKVFASPLVIGDIQRIRSGYLIDSISDVIRTSLSFMQSMQQAADAGYSVQLVFPE